METIIAILTLALGGVIVLSGIQLLASKKVGYLSLKISLVVMYLLLIGDYLYESSLVDTSDMPGISGKSIGVFGSWWPIIPAALLLGIIILQAAMYMRVKRRQPKK
jgi:hypothetical protein